MLKLLFLIVGLKCCRYDSRRVETQRVLGSDRRKSFTRTESVNYNETWLIGLLKSIDNALLVRL